MRQGNMGVDNTKVLPSSSRQNKKPLRNKRSGGATGGKESQMTIKSYFDAIVENRIKVSGSPKQHFAKWLSENGLYTHNRLAKLSEYKRQAEKRKQQG